MRDSSVQKPNWYPLSVNRYTSCEVWDARNHVFAVTVSVTAAELIVRAVNDATSREIAEQSLMDNRPH